MGLLYTLEQLPFLRPILPGVLQLLLAPGLGSTPCSALKQQKLHDHVPGGACANSNLAAGIGTHPAAGALPERSLPRPAALSAAARIPVGVLRLCSLISATRHYHILLLLFHAVARASNSSCVPIAPLSSAEPSTPAPRKVVPVSPPALS